VGENHIDAVNLRRLRTARYHSGNALSRDSLEETKALMALTWADLNSLVTDD